MRQHTRIMGWVAVGLVVAVTQVPTSASAVGAAAGDAARALTGFWKAAEYKRTPASRG